MSDFAHLGNAAWLEALSQQYATDPESVEEKWRYFFEGLALQSAPKESSVSRLIEAYRCFGHLEACFNPLAPKPPAAPELQLENFGLSARDLPKLFPTYGLLPQEEAPLQEILARLRALYCGTMGVEYVGYQTRELTEWLQRELEGEAAALSPAEKRFLLRHLSRAELFETFLHTKYVGQKRFSLEGGETLIPLLAFLFEEGAKLGIEEFVIGMSHRGRLNVLANLLGKSYGMVFSEFEGSSPLLGSGDVKYHKGYSADLTTEAGHRIHVALSPNPSHLESVDPVVEGMTRAKQVRRGEEGKVLSILIHGDGSLAGQGLVYECMQLYRLEGYSTGGTLHLVVNNQISFTTLPKEARSTLYCTDISRTFSAPVFHLNVEDPEGCARAGRLSLEIRQRFGCDLFLDINGYRKYGHNEGDEPTFTQPLEYATIRKRPPIRALYVQRLVEEGVLTQEEAKREEQKFHEHLQQKFDEKEGREAEKPLLEGAWKGLRAGGDLLEPVKTALPQEILTEIGKRISTLPEGFQAHSKLVRLLGERREMAEGRRPIDWAMAELLAMGSLLWEGKGVRLSGQDSGRGTFSQRHALWTDQKSNARYQPLAYLKEGQGRFDVYDSPLSEFAILGFEFGYSLASPETLVLWEAQFGDFANGAQVIIDQYITSSEQKWVRYSGLVLLLPHAYEGQGPEHSSARIERFLQLAGEENFSVVNPTTPAQHFHALRRQLVRPFRKPLIVFTPKGLLRHPRCVSALEDLAQGGFAEVLDDLPARRGSRRLLLCSGHIYYDLVKRREERKAEVAIVRLEQLYPLHEARLREVVGQHAGELFWVQEEPQNMGAWSYLAGRWSSISSQPLRYIGRKASASTAHGSHYVHEKELEEILQEAFKDGD